MTYKELDTLKHIFNQYYNEDISVTKDTIITFINAFDKANELYPHYKAKPFTGIIVIDDMNAKENKENERFYRHFRDLLSFHLNKKYKIRHITWDRAINTYAHRNNINWLNSFRALFLDFCNQFEAIVNDYVYKHQETYDSSNNTINELPQYEQVDLDVDKINRINIDGIEIKTGTFLKLGDLVGNDYTKTADYNPDIIEPLWDLYEDTDKDFKYVKLYYHHKKDSPEIIEGWNLINEKSLIFNRARRVLSEYVSEVQFIIERDNQLFVYTDYFQIEIEKALETKEVQVVETKERNEREIVKHKYLIEATSDAGANFSIGLITSEEMISQIYNSINHFFFKRGWFDLEMEDTYPELPLQRGCLNYEI